MGEFQRTLAAKAASQMTRRGFLIAMTAAGATFGFPAIGRAGMDPAADDGAPVTATGNRFEPSLWYWIDADGTVNVNIIRAEMGQHVGTAIARILADELGANWDDVRITHVDTDAKWGFMVTGGSWSVWQSWPVYRQAGAAGRIALIEAAAGEWGIDPSECEARDGMVRAGDRSISFGELVANGLERSFTEEELKELPLKPLSELTMVGKDVQQLDIATKTTGEAIYGLDAEIDGMVYGAPILPPTRYGCTVTNLDDSEAKSVKGYQQAVVIEDPSGTAPGWVVVIGDTLFAARQAADAIKVEWSTGPSVDVSEEDILNHARDLIDAGEVGSILHTEDHETAPALDAAAELFEAEYTTSTVLHFQMEPTNATAFRNADGIWEVHSGNQWQSLTLPVLAKAVGVGENEVILRSYMLGGGFGRRLNGDYNVPALLASKALDGKPVKLVLSREQDARFDSPRSASVQKLRMAFDNEGAVTAMEHHAAAGWPTQILAPSFMPEGANGEPYDPFAIDGADHWYSVGAHKVRAISNDLANDTFRPGWLRSVGPGWTFWAVESFMDEAARKLGKDPVQFRLDHLKAEGLNAGSAPYAVGGADRQANVLSRVAEMSGYGKTELPEGTAIGIATTFGQSRSMPTWIGGAVKLSVDREDGTVKVDKIWLAVDCGIVVDPDGARAQCEGAALWGLSMALHEGTRFDNGAVADVNLDTYSPLRLEDVPELEIEFVDSQEAPVGLGEPATTVIAPAVANAIEEAVGVRMRSLPITPDALLNALAG
ncbi:molybdopterin cofactor-binding domain-containing protein [Lutimaribacter marinistellae]|uniref:Molybdopterin cofactor-binding domain-containing protein n=1 Tax=Lutimaribacter marinistellae TaxID=1820329 RepID=A0ABV7TEW7_9RHOB